MAKVKNRFTRLGRALSTSHHEPNAAMFKKRSRSISEILDSEQPSISSVLDGGQTRFGPPEESLVLIYHGYTCVDEPRSSKDVVLALRSIRTNYYSSKPVTLTYSNGTLRVAEGAGDGILVCPLHSIGLVVHDVGKGGYNDCLAISFNTGHYAKQCHAFQARSNREAADSYLVLQKCVRSSTKERKLRKTESGTSISSGVVEGSKGRRPMQLMEDEDEFVEHKSLAYNGGRRDSKRSIPAILHSSSDIAASLSGSTSQQTSSLVPSDSSTSSLHQMGGLHHKEKKRLMQRKSGPGRVSSGDHGEFRRQDKVEQLEAAINKIRDNNVFLVEHAKQMDTPTNVFEDSLAAMVQGNLSLLNHYMSLGHVANYHDGSGNTLLHYAVALGNIHCVTILCNNHADLEASGWNDCKPIHRAVAEGHTHILQTLLQNKAAVNSLDLMRRTPLHFASAKMELMECTISLLECGAQVMLSDILGLRPVDLNPDLKETLNRLVTSACETFVSAPINQEDQSSVPRRAATPSSFSPASSPRRSSILDARASGSWDLDHHGDDLTQIVEEVNRQARVMASQTHRRKSGSKKHTHSRSHSNLVDLQNEEDRVENDKLKYPSDCAVDSTYYQMLQDKDQTLRALQRLVHLSNDDTTPRNSHEITVGRLPADLETSLSEPDLHKTNEGGEPRSSSSAAVLQDQRVKSILGGNMTKFRADSGSSTGTLREEDTDSDSLHLLSKAFDDLQDDLRAKGQSDDELGSVERVNIRKSRPLPPSGDSSPLTMRRSKEETLAIFDGILARMDGDSTSLTSGNHALGEAPNQVLLSEMTSASASASPQLTVTKRRVQSSDVLSPKAGEVSRPSSSASFNKGAESSEDILPRAASVEADLIFGTLPKKKKRKWHGIKKITNSPLFRNRRKSFTHGSNHAPSSIAQTSISTYVPSVPVTTEVAENDNIRNSIRSMTPQLSSSKLTGRVESRAGSRGEEGVASKEVLVSPVMINDLVDRVPASKLRKLSMPTPSRRGRGRDECLKALKVMTTLSSNKESLSTLVSYICLPKCINKLIEISQSPQTSSSVLSLVSMLLTNLYQSTDKKTAVGSGVIDLTIKLLQARDPLPTTCLALLNSLLVAGDEGDSLRAIIRIPTAPLLYYLESCEASPGTDSGVESGGHRDTVGSLDTCYSSDMASSTTDEGVGGANLLALPTGQDGTRCSSFLSEASESSSGGRTLLSPTLALQAGQTAVTPPVTTPDLNPRRIVLKMLAVSSTHSKMQSSLTTDKALSLLTGCVAEHSQENVVNALISLANIAQNVRSHKMMLELGIVDVLRPLLTQGPRQRYHATRVLVYLGQLHLLKGCGLFDTSATEYEPDMCTTFIDNDGHSYARGATIEKCIELLTSDFSQLWGGISHVIGPQLQESVPFLSQHASKDQVLQFFLTTYKTYAHPLIVMRLLLHRLSLNDAIKLFDWSTDCGLHPIRSTAHLASVPPTQSNILLLLVRWLELFPDDFLECDWLKEEVDKVIGRLMLAMGPYIPHTHRLRSLLQDVDRPRTEQGDSAMKTEVRAPHHDNLYRLCQQMVTGGHLPVNLHEAIFMASLQLHIEQLCKGSDSAVNVNLRSRRGTVMFRSVFPPGFSKSKGLLKRVEGQMQDFEKLSVRNAKHMYIERCQANPGYDCTFFTVRVPSSGRFKRGPVAKQLMGINSMRIVFLDEKTKELIASHSLQSVSSITRETDPCVLNINLLGDAAGFKVQVDSAVDAKEVANILEERREGEELLDEQALRWSDSVPSLFTMSMEPEIFTADTDSSISTTDHTPTDREGTSPVPMFSYDNLPNHSPDVGVVGPVATPPNGYVETKLSHKSDTLRVLSQDDLLTSDLHDHVTTIDKTKLLQFCDCPPDPEIPPGVDLKAISLVDILASPLEVARQMTLIDHKRFGDLTAIELLQKVHLIPKPSLSAQRDSIASTTTLRSSLTEGGETAVERLAFRFNQVGNWVVHSILQFEFVEERVEVLQQFIAIAKHCLKLGNFNSMMAIVVAGLGSAPVRRLQQTWGQLPKSDMETFKEMDTILDSRGNYKYYRDKLSATAFPAVPYVGVFLKDLTFLSDGNPDYLRGGLINLHKRRQVYRLLEEIRYYQKDAYKLHQVPELQAYLLSHKLKPEDDLHSTSHTLEPRGIRRSHSSSSTKSLSNVQGRSFFRGLTRTSSSGAAYHHRASAASST